jgi:hypothetical protein
MGSVSLDTVRTLRNRTRLPSSQPPRHFFETYWAPTPQRGQLVIHAFVRGELNKLDAEDTTDTSRGPDPIPRLDSESPNGSLDKYLLYHCTTVSDRPHWEVSPCTLLGNDGDSKKTSAADDGGAHSRMPSTRYAMHASGDADSVWAAERGWISASCGKASFASLARGSWLVAFASWLVALGSLPLGPD